MLIVRSRPLFVYLFLVLALVSPPPAYSLTISQVYGGGGNSGTTYTNDFIEIFNDSALTIDLGGISVQYASATGTTWQLTALSGSIAPYHYYLIQEAAGAGGTDSLPTPDVTGSIALSATSGKVALVDSLLALTGACPAAPFLDFVGYGTANCFEGTAPAGALTNTTAALRLLDGLTNILIDANDNANDFTAAAPAPRNSAASLIPFTTEPDPDSISVPEPPTWVLLLPALLAIPWRRRRSAAMQA